MKKWTSNQIGRGLTEYKHPDYDLLINGCMLFFCVSQERNIEGWSFRDVEEKINPTTFKVPKCGHAQKLYGVSSDGLIVKLMEIIDSSD